MKKQSTIIDIAKLAGVSATTVSMALKHHPRISQQTRDRIEAIAEELHYYPNYVARSLVSKKSKTLGLIITSILNPFYPELAKGIEDKAMALGYNIILCSTNYNRRLQKPFVDLLRSKGVDGIILTSVEINDPDIAPLLDDNFPLVLVNRRVMNHTLEKKIDYVVLDNVSGGYMAMQHLQKLGHRRIAIIAGSFDISTAVERTEGARKAMSDSGLTIEPGLIVECSFSKEKAYEATRKLLTHGSSRPTAIFAQNDYMALGAREAVFDTGLRIPEDVALVGFDDIVASSLRGIELTTISQQKYEMGTAAVEILRNRIEDSTAAARQICLPPAIVIRKSCGYYNKFPPKS
ncbi:MAG: LacI family DNA-binding transcriptional regulator [Syntrophales bacterium]